MRRKLLIGFLAVALAAVATESQAGPIRNLVGKLKGKPRAIAAKVLSVGKCAVRLPAKAVGACRSCR